MSGGSAFALFGQVRREDCLRALSLCLLRIATKYPEYWPMIEALWKFTPPKKRTVADKLRELLRDVESGRSV